MLSQAAECFYEKANEDGASSAATAIVSVYVSDLYDVAFRQANIGSKKRYPKTWYEYIKSKGLLFGAIAHYHTSPSLSQERVIGERLARLSVAKDLVTLSKKHSKNVGGILDKLVGVILIHLALC